MRVGKIDVTESGLRDDNTTHMQGSVDEEVKHAAIPATPDDGTSLAMKITEKFVQHAAKVAGIRFVAFRLYRPYTSQRHSIILNCI